MIAVALGAVVAACSSVADEGATSLSEITDAPVAGSAPAETNSPEPAETDTSTAAATSADLVCTEQAPGEVYRSDVSDLPDPADDLASNLPEGTDYFEWSTRDGPESDFAPCYHHAEDSAFDDESLVIGIEIDGHARAYVPDQLIAHVVNDRIGDTPLLVSY